MYRCYAYFNLKISRFFRIIKWLFSIPKVIGKNGNVGKRVLVIFDVSSQPFNIGDFILIQEAALVLCSRHGTEFADIAIVHESKLPPSSIEFSSITDDNVFKHLASILPVAQINQKLGSVFIFNSHRQLERHLTNNIDNCIVWPSPVQYAAKDYAYYRALNDQIYDYFEEFHEIPLFKCRDFLNTWAENFYIENLNSHIPITVNLRNNKLFGTHRNSDMDAWLAFFKSCTGKYPVKFIIVGSRQEIDDRMRDLENVIIAKDFNTGIEQDLALISTSAFHLGAPSGPISMAWFCGKPYLMFSWDADIEKYQGLIKESDDFYRFGFAGKLQKMTKMRETTELIAKEFDIIWKELKLSDYTTMPKEPDSTVKLDLTWFR